MRRVLTIIASIIISIPAFCQTTDRALVEQAISDQAVQVRDTTDLHPIWHLVRHQLTGSCKFAPECIVFLPQAIGELGFVRGTLSFFDRTTRCSRVGTASYPLQLRGRDGKIHEDASAYRRRRRNEED